MTNENYMQLAIDKAFDGMRNGQSPFGACIVKDGQVVAVEHNHVWADTDITAHAEICTIRSACRKLGTIDLSGCVIYSTTEPCPMCFSAIHWAKISTIYYGTSIADAQKAGFNELTVSNFDMKKYGESPVEIIDGVLREKAMELFNIWNSSDKKKTY
jgi:tRNA(Arg) A34 adenosine deaminase TadA